MWRLETQSGQTIYPVLLSAFLAGMVSVWPHIPAWGRPPALVLGVGIIAAPLSYWLVDLLVLIWLARRRVDAEEAARNPPAPPMPDARLEYIKLKAAVVNVLDRARKAAGDEATFIPRHDEMDMGGPLWTKVTHILAREGYVTISADGTRVNGGLTLADLFVAAWNDQVPLMPSPSEETTEQGTL